MNCCKLGKAEMSTVPPSLGELVPQLICLTVLLPNCGVMDIEVVAIL
jgi:hypothetical protein